MNTHTQHKVHSLHSCDFFLPLPRVGEPAVFVGVMGYLIHNTTSATVGAAVVSQAAQPGSSAYLFWLTLSSQGKTKTIFTSEPDGRCTRQTDTVTYLQLFLTFIVEQSALTKPKGV